MNDALVHVADLRDDRAAEDVVNATIRFGQLDLVASNPYIQGAILDVDGGQTRTL